MRGSCHNSAGLYTETQKGPALQHKGLGDSVEEQVLTPEAV